MIYTRATMEDVSDMGLSVVELKATDTNYIDPWAFMMRHQNIIR